MENLLHIDDRNFQRDVLDSTVPVLVDFWAEWCGPCRMMEPSLRELAVEFEGKARVAKLNVDENPQVAERYHVKGMPTFLLFKEGRVVDQLLGARPKGQLAEAIRETLA